MRAFLHADKRRLDYRGFKAWDVPTLLGAEFVTELVIPVLAVAVPLVIALGGGIWGLVVYGRQKRVDRLEDLRKQRRELYSKFIGLIPLLGMSGRVDQGEYQKLKSEIILYGSDDSIRALKVFTGMIERGSSSFSAESKDRIAAYSKLTAALRKDVFPETALEPEQLRSLTPFGDDT